jgi:hypothetical protein
VRLSKVKLNIINVFIHLFHDAVTVSKDKPPNGMADTVITISINY